MGHRFPGRPSNVGPFSIIRANVQRHELRQPLDEGIHRVLRAQIDRQKNSLAVIGRDDEMPLAVHGEALVLCWWPVTMISAPTCSRNLSTAGGVMLRPQMRW